MDITGGGGFIIGVANSVWVRDLPFSLPNLKPGDSNNPFSRGPERNGDDTVAEREYYSFARL